MKQQTIAALSTPLAKLDKRTMQLQSLKKNNFEFRTYCADLHFHRTKLEYVHFVEYQQFWIWCPDCSSDKTA